MCELRKRGYVVRNVSHYGHTLEGMAYHAGQLSGFIDLLEDVRQGGKVPKAITLSGGGNDLAGELFEVVLELAQSGADVVNESLLHGTVDVRLRAAVKHSSPDHCSSRMRSTDLLRPLDVPTRAADRSGWGATDGRDRCAGSPHEGTQRRRATSA